MNDIKYLTLTIVALKKENEKLKKENEILKNNQESTTHNKDGTFSKVMDWCGTKRC